MSDCIIQLGDFFIQKRVSQILESLRAHHSLDKLFIFEISGHPGDQNQEHEDYRIERNVACELVARVKWKKDVDAAEHNEQKNDAEEIRYRNGVQLEQPVSFVRVFYLKFE